MDDHSTPSDFLLMLTVLVAGVLIGWATCEEVRLLLKGLYG